MLSKILKIILITLVSFTMVACGGGGGSSDSGSDNASINNEAPSNDNTAKSFSVHLVSLDITRVSNGETVDVDVSGISSGNLVLEPTS